MKNLVRNHLAQPVELHLPGRTLVIAPHGHAELDEGEETSAHVRHLCDTGCLTTHEPSPAAPQPAPKTKERDVRTVEAAERGAAEARKGNKKT